MCEKGQQVVYYESIKRELKIRCIYECRCDERLQTKTKDLTHTGLVVELEHLEIETRLIDEKFARMMPTHDLSSEEKAVWRKWKNDPIFDCAD